MDNLLRSRSRDDDANHLSARKKKRENLLSGFFDDLNAPDPDTTYMTFVPLAKDADGLRPAWPKVAQEGYRAALRGGRAALGGFDGTIDMEEMKGAALDGAMAAQTGGIAATAAVPSLAPEAGALAANLLRRPELERVSLHTNLAKLKGHPDYQMAKRGGAQDPVEAGNAAWRLVGDVYKPSSLDPIRERLGGVSPAVAPVHLYEQGAGEGGSNRIPFALALRVADTLGGEVTPEIVQRQVAGRTEADRLERFLRPALFDGPVEHKRPYVVVDDVFTTGGTLGGLTGHIEDNGGLVLGANALAAGRKGAKFSLSQDTLDALRDRHGQREDLFREGFGHDFAGLTQHQADILRGADPDTFRSIVTQARGSRYPR